MFRNWAYASQSIDHYDITTMLPHPTTIGREVKRKYDGLLLNLQIILQKHCTSTNEIGAGAMTADHWTDKYSGHNFLGMTFHHIDNWVLKRRVVACEFVPPCYTHSAIDIINFVQKLMKEQLGFLNGGYKIRFTTDSASSESKAFNSLRCYCHRIQTCCSDTFQDNCKHASGLNIDGILLDIIKMAKSITALAKRTNLNSHLPTKIKQCVATRWNSTLHTLESVFTNSKFIQEVCFKPCF
jgi:hypothetical protein